MSRAVIYLILATSLFSLINVGVKTLAHLPASEIVFFRGLLAFAICFVLLKRKKVPVLGNNKKVLLLRGFFGTVALFSLFICIQKVSLAVSMTLINLTPILTVVIAHIVLKEKAKKSQWLFLLVSFVGVYLIRGGVEPVPLVWILLGLFAALMASGAYTCVRHLRLTEDPLVVILYFPLVTVPLVGPFAAFEWVPPQGYHDWLWLAGIGILTQLAQYFMTLAYQMEKAAKIMIFNYTGLFWGVIFGYLIFDEVLTLQQCIGIAIVFFCLCGNYFVSLKKAS